jgi:hypothetical protein
MHTGDDETMWVPEWLCGALGLLLLELAALFIATAISTIKKKRGGK